MTGLPDWLVERAALDEVAPTSRERIERVERADPHELATRIAALRADNAAELAAHPPGPAIAIIERRVVAEIKRVAAERRRRRMGMLGMLSAAAAAVAIFVIVKREPASVPEGQPGDPEVTRPKGVARLAAFRQSGEQAEQLEPDTLVQAGDLVQLRYNAGGRGYGVIASLDGDGVVTLHFPLSEDAAPEATALAAKPTALPHAYELDDAPHFERFFFITAYGPVDVKQSLASLRALARRSTASFAPLDLPRGLHQWSLRLRKPDRPSTPPTP